MNKNSKFKYLVFLLVSVSLLGYCFYGNLFGYLMPESICINKVVVYFGSAENMSIKNIYAAKTKIKEVDDYIFIKDWSVVYNVSYATNGLIYENGITTKGRIFSATKQQWANGYCYLWCPNDSNIFIQEYNNMVNEYIRKSASPNLLDRLIE